MATIYDVAKKAGVGIGTVSRVLNKKPHISEKTRLLVEKAISDLDFQPHSMARNLARRRTNTVACIIPFFTGFFFVQLLSGIQRKITHFEKDLILYSVDSTIKKETFLSRVLKEHRVDGVLYVSLEISDADAARFTDHDFPIVLVDSYHPDLDSIKVDNVGGAVMATNHLIALGYNRIAMIDGQLKSVPARLRLAGYKNALENSGIPFRDRYFIACDFAREADGFNQEGGYAAMQQLLALGDDRPDAVFVSSDIQAIGAMQAIREQGLRIPEDVAVVGFDDIELARHVGLTTVRQPTIEMGELAVERLVQRIDGRPAVDFQQRLGTEVIVRDTCGAKLRSAVV